MIDARAGSLPLGANLIDVDEVLGAYYENVPDVDDEAQRVVFGTSGHRGSSLGHSFNEAHIVAMSAAIAEYRKSSGVQGPLFIGADTHLLSEPALKTAVETLVTLGVRVKLDARSSFVPTPAVSHAILRHNSRGSVLNPQAFTARPKTPATSADLADGIVVTPSHNPPTDGGFKYNAAHGGPADTDATTWIAERANKVLRTGHKNVPQVDFKTALKSELVSRYDFRQVYVEDLKNVLDLEAISRAGVRIGADPLGGASLEYWDMIAEIYKLDITVLNPTVDPRFPGIALDWDGKIRMDCSSSYSMQGVVDRFINGATFDIQTGNDADSDRHGIVLRNMMSRATKAPSIDPHGEYIPGLMNPNHFLSVCINYLYSGARPNWARSVKIGKTLVSSGLIDKVAHSVGADKLVEVPVGFKWFVPGLINGELGFGGEESSGASFLRLDGKVWTTDKDGPIMNLLASEIIATTGKNPAEHYRELVEKYGQSWYKRVDAVTTLAQKNKLKNLSPEQVTAQDLAGDVILSKLTKAPGNDAPIGGLKVVTQNAWFACRPSGTENVCKIYAESFTSGEHLEEVLKQAEEVVGDVIS
ncbi:MAG: phosphoglucomutase [Candidatus Ancillula trichonymphae]|jgi:phosphoglucomutase|nr:phosphoglucomutase [Candidatus Ancillula trichonymphae]